MKVSRVYEVWVGGDMVEDHIQSLDQAIALARIELATQLKEHPEDPADVVLDEHTYVEIEDDEDLDLVDFVPKWREMNDTES